MEDATPFLEDGQSLLLDGFPRNLQQAKALEEVAHIDTVVNLDVPTETIVERIADRWIHPASGRIYSYAYKPPKVPGKDDVTGETLVQREDDKPASVRQRLAAYDKVSRKKRGDFLFSCSRERHVVSCGLSLYQVTAPLVQWYKQKGVLRTFHGTQSDQIYPEVKKWLEERDFH